MTYETVAAISQVTTLLMFVAMFAGVLAYALWPSNGAKFAKVQTQALDLDRRPETSGGNHDK